jgi:hypothetical protein
MTEVRASGEDRTFFKRVSRWHGPRTPPPRYREITTFSALVSAARAKVS